MPVMTWTKLLTAHEQTSSPPGTARLTRAELLLAGAVAMTVLLVAWSSQFVHPAPTMHRVAQFAHLMFVVIGLGSVLVVDWYGLRWQLGHTSLESVVATAGMLTIPTWFGLGGLLLSGLFLEPDLAGPMTQVKIGMVAGASVVGVLAVAMQRRLSTIGIPRPASVVRFALVLAVASQVCWWSATVIGFFNRT